MNAPASAWAENVLVDDDIERAHLLGKKLWTPDVEFDRHSFAFVGPLCKMMLEIGMTLGRSTSDLETLLSAVQDGMDEARPITRESSRRTVNERCASQMESIPSATTAERMRDR